MRTAAMVLGIIAGVLGIFVGLFGWGMVALSNHVTEAEEFLQLSNPKFIQFASFMAPMLCIAGGAMAKSRALWGGIGLLIAAALFFAAFGFGAGTMFPIGFAALGGILAIAAGKPDEEKAHF